MTLSLFDQLLWQVTRSVSNDPTILGSRGQISQYSDGSLDIWVTSRYAVKILECHGWRAKSRYDDGSLFIRPYGDLDEAALAIKAKRRRKVDPGRRKILVERLATMRSLKKNSLRKGGFGGQSREEALSPVKSLEGPSGAV